MQESGRELGWVLSAQKHVAVVWYVMGTCRPPEFRAWGLLIDSVILDKLLSLSLPHFLPGKNVESHSIYLVFIAVRIEWVK